MEFHKFLNFLSFFNFYRISYLSFSFSHLMFLIFGSYRTIGFLESTCRFINAPSLVSPDLSFNEISILVFCCAFRGDWILWCQESREANGLTIRPWAPFLLSSCGLLLSLDGHLLTVWHSTVVCLQSFLVDIYCKKDRQEKMWE